ncbi:MAG: hypothetical protein CMK92_02555 [Pseudomonas sp.]|nr:hypothetical protein [Pseudomonas sp.]
MILLLLTLMMFACLMWILLDLRDRMDYMEQRHEQLVTAEEVDVWVLQQKRPLVDVVKEMRSRQE